jgi:hypothetical protein
LILSCKNNNSFELSKQNHVRKIQKFRTITKKTRWLKMSARTRVIGFFAMLGFMGGIIANLTSGWVIPKLIEVFPQLLKADWLFWGFAGALLAMAIPVVWAYISTPRE